MFGLFFISFFLFDIWRSWGSSYFSLFSLLFMSLVCVKEGSVNGGSVGNFSEWICAVRIDHCVVTFPLFICSFFLLGHRSREWVRYGILHGWERDGNANELMVCVSCAVGGAGA